MNICKFGGSSIQHIEQVDNILKPKISKYKRVLVIVSAFGNTTDLLLTNIEEVYTFHNNLCIKLFGKVLLKVTDLIQNIKLLSQVINTFKVIPDQLKERLLSYGELLSSVILYNYFNKIYTCDVYRMNSENIIVKNITNNVNYEETTKRLHNYLSIIDSGLIICPGYICSDINGLEKKYNKIICIAILEHVYDPSAAVANLKKMLKDGGVIYGYVPYLYYYHAPKDLKFQDYFRFSKDALAYLFKDFNDVELFPIRGRVSTPLNILFAGRWKQYAEKTNINIYLDKLSNDESNLKQCSGFNFIIKK